MNQTSETNLTVQNFQPSIMTELAAARLKTPDEIYYPTSFDEDEMGETMVHSELIANFLKWLQFFFMSRNDVLIAANLNVYYEEGNPQKWLAPDLLVCFGVENKSRRIFKVWEEKQFPQVVFEVASDRTWRNDAEQKKDDYERLGVEEYYLLDPEREYLQQPLMAFHRENDKLKPIPVIDYRVFSPRLGLELVDMGKTFRFYDRTRQEFLMTLEESMTNLELVEAKLEQAEAEIARLQELLRQKQ